MTQVDPLKCLISMETLDRTSPELWPEPMPGMSDIAHQIRATSAAENEPVPSWKQPLDIKDEADFQRYKRMPMQPLLHELKSLYDFAYTLGLDEANEMTRGKYLKIFNRETKKPSE